MSDETTERLRSGVLVLAPLGRDAPLAVMTLERAGIPATTCADARALTTAIDAGAGAAVVAEEALAGAGMREVAAAIDRQPAWSDFPMVVLASRHDRPLAAFAPLGNVWVLDRPLGARVLVSAVEMALRARRRQYDAEAARARAEAELREATEFQKRLIGVAGHDLRNPLSSILLSASMLASTTLDERQRRGVRRIEGNAARMTRIIADLADYTRARTGSPLPVRPAPCDVHQLCQAVLDELRMTHPEATVRYQPDGDPGGDWDGERLQQLIANLLINAFKYGAPGTPVTLRWTRESGDGALVIEVHNQGEPIPPDLAPVIFEPFRLGAQRAASGPPSLGLGLFIVREIARAHGGEVEVTSVRDEGTTFRVRLPRSAPRPAPSPGERVIGGP